MADYCTLADVKLYSGITGTADDALLSTLITAASLALETVCNRVFSLSAYVDVLDGNGRDRINLSESPIASITSLTIDGQAVLASTGWNVTGYTVDNDGSHTLYLVGKAFSRGRRNVSVSYQAGYAATPADLKQATVELVALKYRQKEVVGIESKTLAGESVHFEKIDFPESVERVVQNYMKRVPL